MPSSPQTIELLATVLFAFAVIHTFLSSQLQKLAHRYPEGSVGENFFHLLGEVEVVFGIWAGLFILGAFFLIGIPESIAYLESRNFTEPAFVFVIMAICATRPILELAGKAIDYCAALMPLPKNLSFYMSTLIVGPLLGSFITEPAAMTVTALILLQRLYSRKASDSLKYATLGLLFVNVSIGGTLTPYAAPPVLMVAPKWGWDITFMLTHFGWKAALAILISTSIITFRFRKELLSLDLKANKEPNLNKIPVWVTALHLLVLAGVILGAHHMVIFFGLFLLFLGVATVTSEYQSPLRLRESLLVAFFLAGLVVLGGQQGWWISPILNSLSALPLFLGAITLTSFTDNAAITYLGSLVPNLSDLSKYALVAGSVVGGGLTVIANAPNPAGYSTLNPAFGENGIKPLYLLRSALLPTLIAGICFWFL